MAKIGHLQNNFSGGQISPMFSARVDSDRYSTSVMVMQNYIALLQGPAVRRPGTTFIAEVADSSAYTRLIPFSFSVYESYILEFGNFYIRFYLDYKKVMDGEAVYEVATPYPTAVLPLLRFTQSADVLWLTHPLFEPYILSRYGDIDWILNPFEFEDGPYLDVNTTSTTFTPSAIEGEDVLVTAGTSVSKVITAFTNNSGLIQLTVPSHGYSTGNAVVINSVFPPTLPEQNDANGEWLITVIDADNFTLDGSVYYTEPLPPPSKPYTGGTVTLQLITNCTAYTTGEILVTLPSHGFSTGQVVLIQGVLGTTEANGSWSVVVVDANTFALSRSVFQNAYVSNGAAILALFEETDVGRLIRIQSPAQLNWGWAVIASVVDSLSVLVDIQVPFGNTTPAEIWQLGLWSNTTGWPSSCSFHEDRLVMSGVPTLPYRVDLSASGAYPVYSPTELDDTITDSTAVSLNLSSSQVNGVVYTISDEKGLIVGTSDSEWLISPSSFNEALTPTNARAVPTSNHGCANDMPVQAGKSILFIQSKQRKVREMSFRFDVEGYMESDLTQIAENITLGGISTLVYQQEPIPVVWTIRGDGALLGLTYERDSQVLRAGWHTHILGGVSDAEGNPPIVESIAAIPSPDGTRDDLWMVVQRYINGEVVRYIEVINTYFDTDQAQETAYFVDCGLTYQGVATNTIAGLDFLEGQTVQIYGNGAVYPEAVVTGGTVNVVGDPVTIASIGYGYKSLIKTLRMEGGSQIGPSLGKLRRISRCEIMLYDTLGIQIGFSEDVLFPVSDRTIPTMMDTAPSVLNGIFDQFIQGSWNYDNYLYVVQTGPTPGKLLALPSRVEVEDAL